MRHIFIRPGREDVIGAPGQKLLIPFLDACNAHPGAKPKWGDYGTTKKFKKDPPCLIAKCKELGYYLYDAEHASYPGRENIN